MSKKMKLPYQYAILIFLLACCSLRADETTVVVEPDGPIATLEQARMRVREVKKEKPGQPIEVLVKSGVYSLRETVVFGLEDLGV